MSNTKYWNKKIETMPVKKLRETQLKRLKGVVKHCYRNVPFYRRRLKESGVEPGDVKSLKDLKKIPFTVKGDLISSYPFGMLAVEQEEIIEVHASSGTTGNPTIGAYTRSDLDVWQELMARSIYAVGGRKGDVLHNAYGYGLFTGGLGFHYGGQIIGVTVIPVSGGMTKRQVKLMKDLGATILCCTPSFAAYLAGYMEKEGVDPKEDTSLRLGMFGAEPWSEELRKRIEDDLYVKAFDIYGLTELCGPGVSVECSEQNGLHVWEDHFFVEVIDPDTGEALSPGEEGELVFTTLTKDGLPVLRYRTRDISVIDVDECACGRTHSRMKRIRGRSDDMLIVKGVNLFPSQIEHVLMSFPELASQYQIILDRFGMDVLTIRAELTKKAFKDLQHDPIELKKRIENEIRNVVGIRADIDLVEPGRIDRSMGKAKRVIDMRKGKM